MTDSYPGKPQDSLFERAAQAFDFEDFMRPSGSSPATSKPVLRPASPVAPVAHPAQRTMPGQAAPVTAPPRPMPMSPQPMQPMHSSPAAQRAPQSVQPMQPSPSQRGFAGARRIAELNMEQLRTDGFIEPGAAPTMLSEEFRLAKRQILLSAFGGRNTRPVERGRAVLVCSASPNEGKTFCSINLAMSLSTERDLEVLLIDVDVAKPEILSTLGIEGGPGLMDAIADPNVDPESLVIQTSLPSLSVLPTGRRTHDDTELLASRRTQDVMERLMAHSSQRIIVIDTAPALAASPGSVLAHHVGQVVMVVRADKTGENELREAIGLLDGCEHIQLLLNGATYSGANQKFGSYYGYGG